MPNGKIADFPGIYLITDLTVGKSYLGSSQNVVQRFRQHNWALQRGNHANRDLQEAYNKGNVLVPIPFPINDNSNVLEIEKTLIDEFKGTDAIYNLHTGASSPMLGKSHSEETKAKMSEVAQRRVRTPEHIANMRLSNVSRTREVTFKGVKYESTAAASEALGIPTGTLYRKLREERNK